MYLHSTFVVLIFKCLCPRHLKQLGTESMELVERRQDALEVEGLCELPRHYTDRDGPQKSDVVERIQKKRKLR